MQTIKILILTCASFVGGLSRCAEKVERTPEKCFIFSPEKRSWNDSNNMCLSQGSSLAAPKHHMDHEAIGRALKGLDTCFWIGIKRNPSSFSGYSFTSTHELVRETYWNTGEPNNPLNEQCVDYKQNQGHIGWNDERCDRQCFYVCQDNECPPKCVKKEIPHIKTCSNGTMKVGSTCFIYNRTLSNWEDARKACSDKGLRLTKMEKQERDDITAYLTTLQYADGTSFWTAGRRQTGVHFVYSGWFKPVPPPSPDMTSNWSPGEPNNADGSENCMAGMFNWKGTEGIKLNDDNCNRRYKFICLADGCPEDCTQEDGTTTVPLPTTVENDIATEKESSTATDASSTGTVTTWPDSETQRSSGGNEDDMYSCTTKDNKLQCEYTKFKQNRNAYSKGSALPSTLLLELTVTILLCII